ncbi:hypothetical protein [Qipengyuania sp.]|uniref:hypothetical protein n=1 Tax=Qipengyuania sp. TaxID=2004515 RepID=UPI003AF97A27
MTRKADPRETRLPVPRGELPPFDPVPRRCARHDGWTATRQRRFIEALADSGSVESACRTVNMSTVGAYHLRRQPGADSFRAAWEAALDLGVQRIEDAAMDRALNGTEETIHYHGEHVATRRRYNERLVMFILRNRAAGRFGEHGAKGPDAVGRMELERLRKQWRAEWEEERSSVSVADIRESIEHKVEEFRDTLRTRERREWARLSQEARDAFVAYARLRARDLDCEVEIPHSLQEAEGDAPRENWWDAPEEWREEERGYGTRAEVRERAVLLPPERGEEETEMEAPPEDAAPRLRSLKDDGWR